MANLTYEQMLDLMTEIEPNVAILLDKDQNYFWYVKNKIDNNMVISQKEAQEVQAVYNRMINLQYSG